MRVPENEVQRRIESLTVALRAEGLRLTHQRLEIVREIAGTNAHPDVERIYDAVRERVPTVSIDTVYRTMAALVALGLVNRVSPMPGPARYDANLRGHHHFVCTRCGSVYDIEDIGLDQVQAPAATTALGTVESTEVQFKGVCRACSA